MPLTDHGRGRKQQFHERLGILHHRQLHRKLKERFPAAFNTRWTRRHWLHASLFVTLGALLATIVPGFSAQLQPTAQANATLPLQLPPLTLHAPARDAGVFWDIVQVESGQTLGEVFESMGVPAATMHRILDNPANQDALARLRPGAELGFALDEEGALRGFRFDRNPTQRVDAEMLSTVWGPDNAKGVLRAIPVQGTIMADASDGAGLMGGTYGYEVADLLDGLKAGDAGGVVLLINTPGGSINGSRAMADAIDRYRERTGHKVFAYVQGMSASGGMYTMAGADEILADHGSLVGSVGVILGPLQYYNGVVALDGGIFGGGVTTTGGISSEYITAGRGKDAGNPYRPLTEEERAMFQSWVDQEYVSFVDQVATKRKIERTVMTEEVGAGILGTDRAQQVGYIDGVMGRPEAFRHFAEASGLDPNDTKLVQSEGLGFWASLLGFETRPLGTALAAEPVEGQPARVSSVLCTSRTPLAWVPEAAVSFCG